MLSLFVTNRIFFNFIVCTIWSHFTEIGNQILFFELNEEVVEMWKTIKKCNLEVSI